VKQGVQEHIEVKASCEESTPGIDDLKIPEIEPEEESKEETQKEPLAVPIEETSKKEELIHTNVAGVVQLRSCDPVGILPKIQEKKHPLIELEDVDISDDDFFLVISDVDD
jgi:hypothetical protein